LMASIAQEAVAKNATLAVAKAAHTTRSLTRLFATVLVIA
jgi:hypothetical protein